MFKGLIRFCLILSGFLMVPSTGFGQASRRSATANDVPRPAGQSRMRAGDSKQQSVRPDYLPGEVIIKMKPSAQAMLRKGTGGATTTGIAPLDKVLTRFQGTELKPIFPRHARPTPPGGVDLTKFYCFHYRDGSDPRDVTRALEATGAIEYAEPHYICHVDFVPNDSRFGKQWHLKKIKADSAWDVTEGDTSVVVGIVDTGVEWYHPDLWQNIWHNAHPTMSPPDTIGWDFGGVDGTPDNNPDEFKPYHGTAAAGVVSAVTNDSIGVAGVGFKCKVMAVKASQDNDDQANIIYGFEGMVYAADHGASVINASWGHLGYSQYEQDVINYVTSEGALVVAAAGNDASNEAFYPASYDHVLAVAATDSGDRKPSWSNYGPQVGISSPGVDILGTWKPDTYIAGSGTSPAAEIVSGAAALVKSIHPKWTPAQIAEQIRVTADPIDALNPNYAQQLGLGRVNAFRAVSDTSSPGIQMTSYTLSDSIGGNNDSLFSPGETIRLVGQFTNFLHASTNAKAQLSSSDSYISIVAGDVPLGTINTMQTVSNTSSPLAFEVRSNTPPNHQAVIYVNFTDGSYHDYTSFSVMLNPMYESHIINTNGGFENARPGVQQASDIPGWFLQAAGGAAATFEITGDEAEEGKSSLRVDVGTLGINAWDIQAINLPFTVVPGTQYTYSVWAKADIKGPLVDFTVGSPTYVEWGNENQVPMTTGWQHVTFQFTAPADASTGRAPIHFGERANTNFLPFTI